MCCYEALLVFKCLLHASDIKSDFVEYVVMTDAIIFLIFIMYCSC